jgi:hypothetical protein
VASPTARTLAQLRASGVLAAVVERWVAQARRRVDLFGFVDIVGIEQGKVGVLGVQATTTENISHRLDKLRAECAMAMRLWLEAGNRLEIHGWAKQGPRGARKLWTLTVRAVSVSDLGA